MNFSSKLFWTMVALFTLGAVLLVVFLHLTDLAILESNEKESLNRLSEDMAGQTIMILDRFLFERAGDLRVLTDLLSSSENSPSSLRSRLLSFRDAYRTYASLSFFAPDGTRLADTADLPLGEKEPLIGYWRDVLKGRASYGRDVRFVPSLNATVVHFAAPVYDERFQLKGVVVTRVPVSQIASILNSSLHHRELKGAQMQLFDPDCSLIYDTFAPMSLQPQRFLNCRQPGSDLAQGARFSIAHEEGFADFTGNGWTLVVRLPSLNKSFAADRLRLLAVLAILGIFLSILAVIRFVTHRFLGSIGELSKAARNLEQGNFDTRVDLSTGDELEDLGLALNHALREMKRTEDQRKQLEQMKSSLMSMVSHELRSPMTPMRAQLQMLLGGYFGRLKPEQKESLLIVLRNTVHLDRLIQDFLDLSRLESAHLRFDFSQVYLNTSIDRVVQELRPSASLKNVKVRWIKSFLPVIAADPDRVMQVLRNLIGNAVKFSRVGGLVEVRAFPEKGFIHFTVEDYGKGIRPENRTRIFEPFFQEEPTLSRTSGGAGLGLALCKGIVECQGGKIWFKSQAGKGTTFHFTVPLKPVREPFPVSLLVSRPVELTTKAAEIFVEFLGPVGEVEFQKLSDAGLTQSNLSAYVRHLARKKILAPERAFLFERKVLDALGEYRNEPRQRTGTRATRRFRKGE